MRRALTVAATTILAASLAYGLGGFRVYRNEAMRVHAFEVPRGWETAPQASYPRILVLALGPEEARLTLAAQHVARGASARAVADGAAAALRRQGFAGVRVTVGPDERARLDATFDGGRRLLKQVYQLDGDLAFVVTLASRTNRPTRVLKDFEDALASLVISPLPEAADGGGAANPDGS